ncbi:MAG: hypothetical protein ACREGB_05390 [Candidatus Saccharimonadales bacterium]
MTIHFICRGNIFRSLIAETYLKSLQIPGITTLSSGTIADETRESNHTLGYTANTRELLARHKLTVHAKPSAEQLTQERLADNQLVICANQIAYDEAVAIARLPKSTIIWDVTDIGEGSRIANSASQRKLYEEEVFSEITGLVDELVRTHHLSKA